MWLQIVCLLLLFAGEALSVYSEMKSAHAYEHGSLPSMTIFIRAFILMAMAGAFLIGGYMVGYRAFKSIWVVSVVSITSILIMEPILAWGIFQETPARGALVGFVLGALGFVATFVL